MLYFDLHSRNVYKIWLVIKVASKAGSWLDLLTEWLKVNVLFKSKATSILMLLKEKLEEKLC